MAENKSNIRSNLKISLASKGELEDLFHQLSEFSLPYPRKFHFLSTNIVFLAKHKGSVLGFLTLTPLEKGEFEISALYTRLGFDRKGVGSKLLGKANSYLINKGAKKVTLSPARGRRLVNAQIEKTFAEDFYKKTNYSLNQKDYRIPKFEWIPTRNPRVRKPKTKPLQMSPQNLLRKPKFVLNRRR